MMTFVIFQNVAEVLPDGHRRRVTVFPVGSGQSAEFAVLIQIQSIALLCDRAIFQDINKVVLLYLAEIVGNDYGRPVSAPRLERRKD
jgi:hypothetical protein